MTSIKDDIATVLQLPAVTQTANTNMADVTEAKDVTIMDPEDMPPSDFEVDFENARANIQELLASGHSLYDLANDFARDSESARAFEVATGLLKVLAATNINLLEIHEKKQRVTGVNQEKVQDITVEKAVFIGSSTELQKELTKD